VLGIALHHDQLLRRVYRLCLASRGSCSYLCPFGSNVPLHFVHLCSGHSKLLAFRWSELPHASHTASHTALPGQLLLLCPFGSSAPLHFEHLCSGHAKLLEFRWSELPHALHRFGLHSRAEWPVSPHVLHTRYGHVPLFWRCPDCAHSVQYFSHAESPVRCDSDPQ
jgi:hypothetical protein